MNTDCEARYAVRETTLARVDGETTVIINTDSGSCYTLDAVGTRIWQLLQASYTVEEIAGSIIAEYDVTPERCRSDLAAMLAMLAEEQIIEVTAPDGSNE